MHAQQSDDATLQSLMKMLESKDGLVRQKARIALVEMGDPAVIPLSEALAHSKLDHTRWGAAKALGEMVDVRSISALVNALDDTDADVAWLAGLALKKFEKGAWRLLLQKLIESGVDSVRLRNGARHVFSGQKVEGFNDLLEELMTALEDSALPEAGGIAAGEILKRMRSDKANTWDISPDQDFS
jgi:HEAT repeat protein